MNFKKHYDTLLVIIAFLFLFAIVRIAYADNETEANNGTFTKVDANMIPQNYGAKEWISPDGVHYWVYFGPQRYGIAPRILPDGSYVTK